MSVIQQKIREWEHRPFAYGEDCCRFAADCVHALTGVDYMADFEYSDERSAFALIARYGGLQRAIESVLGPPAAPESAETGDVLLIVVSGRQMAAIAFNGVAVVRTKTGLIDVPAANAVACWRLSCLS